MIELLRRLAAVLFLFGTWPLMRLAQHWLAVWVATAAFLFDGKPWLANYRRTRDRIGTVLCDGVDGR